MWASRDGSGYCYHHQNEHTRTESERRNEDPKAEPSGLPGVTKQQLERRLEENETAAEKLKGSRKRKEARKKAKTERDRETATKEIVKVTKQTLTNEGEVLPPSLLESDTKLRTLEDCLCLIETAVDELVNLGASINKSKALIAAARTAGNLIIQAGVANKAVDWFMDNVKLVANVDLDKV